MNEKESGIGDAIGKVQDSVGAAVGKASASTMGSHSAKSFVKNAAIGNRYELEAARVALERTRSDEIRQMAQTILTDHEEVERRMPEFVARADTEVEIPTELDQRRNGMADNLRQASDEAFDNRFIEQQVAAHEEAVTLFEGYEENGDDAELKAFARETLPTLRQHLEHARRLQGH